MLDIYQKTQTQYNKMDDITFGNNIINISIYFVDTLLTTKQI